MAFKRSPSPNPSRSSNPSPKSQENSSVLRKSGTFPSKHCISSAIPQRNSSSKSATASALPSPRGSFEQKENERDLHGSKQARTRSPAENPYKVMKSFMAPTISASSKITVASPRKKILSERNEDSGKKPSVLVEGVQVEEIQPKSEMDFDSEGISDRNRSTMIDFSSSRGHQQSTDSHYPSHRPSDADPSLSPYDPTTNYLSPRPQFLHYRPKPMIEQNHGFTEDLFYVGGDRRLEDSFSDTEGSEDCSEYSEETKSSPVNNEPGDEYASTMLNIQEVLVPDETHVSEPKPRAETYRPRFYSEETKSSPVNNEPGDEYASTMLNIQEALVPDETYVSEPKPRAETYRPRFYNRSFRKSKIIPFLLFLSIVFFCLPLPDLPIFPPIIMKYETFAGPHIQAFAVLKDVHFKDHLAFAGRSIQGLVSRLRQWSLDSIDILSFSGSTSRDEPDMILSFNMTLSPSIAQNVGLDFGYSFELETIRKKEIVEARDDPVNNMESEFEVDRIAPNALLGNDIDDGEKINLKFSDVNGDVARDEMVQEREDDNCAKHEEGLNSFTDPAFEFETMNKKDHPMTIDAVISEEVDGKGYLAAFEIVQMLEEQILVDSKQENSHSSTDENIKVELSEMNGDVEGDEIVQQGDEGGLGSFIDQPKKIDIAISEEVEAQKFEAQVLMESTQENIHLINKDHIDSFTDLVVASQMMKQKDDAGVVNFLSEVQPSVFVDAYLIQTILGVLAAITLVFLFMKLKYTQSTSDEKHLNKKNSYVSGGTVTCTDYKNEHPYHNLTGLVEVVGDSGPTEMSSSLNNSFSGRHQRRKIASHEVTPTEEFLQRRESGVSSSISYGSFTAFEKTSARKGEKDEEVMTPVRRSSRIRNQAISP